VRTQAAVPLTDLHMNATKVNRKQYSTGLNALQVLPSQVDVVPCAAVPTNKIAVATRSRCHGFAISVATASTSHALLVAWDNTACAPATGCCCWRIALCSCSAQRRSNWRHASASPPASPAASGGCVTARAKMRARSAACASSSCGSSCLRAASARTAADAYLDTCWCGLVLCARGDHCKRRGMPMSSPCHTGQT